MLVVLARQLAVVAGRVGPPAAVPRAVHVLPRHGNGPGHGLQRAQRGLVVLAVDEEVKVLHVVAVAGGEPAVAPHVGPRVVDEVPPVAAQQALGQGQGAGHGVDRRHRSAQVAALLVRQAPAPLLPAGLEEDAQVVLPERQPVVIILDTHGRRRKHVGAAPARHAVVHLARRAVHGEERRVVEKLLVLGILHAHQVVGDEREAAVADHDGPAVGPAGQGGAGQHTGRQQSPRDVTYFHKQYRKPI